MTRSKTFLIAVGICAALVGASVNVAVAAGPADAIAARQANFKKMGGAMKVLKDQLSSGAISKPQAVAAAKTLAATARAQARLFPDGSGPGAGVKTKALPAIWTDRTGFNRQLTAFIAQADKLVVAANTGKADVMGAQFKATGAACASCHKQFRADD